MLLITEYKMERAGKQGAVKNIIDPGFSKRCIVRCVAHLCGWIMN